ncbi:MAG: pyruvate, phosphate dikinase [Clostridia bacterium]|nr:pyruvate, phosphate dikinase [Clostridia bacterium]
MDKKYIYMFKDGDASMRNLLGGKGANLAEMTKLGLPVPQGFVISTEACTKYYEDNESINEQITEGIFNGIKQMEKINNKKFGDANNPMLVSVRSGARVSMPGMMDTILNLGLNDKTVEGFAKVGNERLAYDSYRRFIQMFSNVVMELDMSYFERALENKKEKKGVSLDTDLTASDLKELVAEYKVIYKKLAGVEFIQDTHEQLIEAVKAVFRSWQTKRAVYYRRMHDIPSEWGTAVNVQTMVFGNKNENSGTGVAFTRNPSTGEKILYGEYLFNAQGEDVVAGIRTPHPMERLKEEAPILYEEFVKICSVLEKHYKDMQDMEFTIEDGKLFMLQTRNGKRTAKAALKISVDLVSEGLITKQEALLKIDPLQLDALLHPQFEESALKEGKVIAEGLPASPGAGSGIIVFDSNKAVEFKEQKIKTILVREETSPEDIEGMNASEGILTSRGGMTSHAAVVARGMGLPCVAGCGAIHINEKDNSFILGQKAYKEGNYISLDGSTGKVYDGLIKTTDATLSEDFKTIMSWAKEYKKLGVRTNADTPHDAKQAYDFGAEGIGLTRTEHMFFEESRIMAVREMILSETLEGREKALAKILPMQKEDFIGIYKAMKGYPVTIRFLDPPLHEFLPHNEKDILNLAKEMGVSFEILNNKVDSLKEFNPMLGHRGVRLSITYPEIARMQTQAIIEAAIAVKAEMGYDIKPEIMIPLVGDKKEFDYVKAVVVKEADKIIKESGIELSYTVGTMIEVPRAALLADEIAKSAEFFSFGTNDLTQMTYGFSRDDAGTFLNDYYSKKIFDFDPFSRIDFDGVGKLIEMATKLGKSTRPNLKVGICGEQGGNPVSVEFCHNVGLDYVSCSPYRVPIAILAAAHANIKNPK